MMTQSRVVLLNESLDVSVLCNKLLPRTETSYCIQT